jgi:short-subunit dehydrogenase
VAFELRGTGVHVTLLKPGYTHTEMSGDSAPDPASIAGRVLWLQADDVARAAVDAVEQGRLQCVPGATWKVANAVVQSLPRAAVRAISSRVRTN